MKKNVVLILALFLLSASCLSGGGPLGVLKTYDGGGAWLAMDRVSSSSSQSISSLQVSHLAFNPVNREEIFLSALNGGLWKSSDSAQTWKVVLSKINAYDFAVNPQDPNNILVSGIYNNHGKIVRTRDGGATWEEVYNEASTDNTVTAITVNYSRPAELYAGLDSGVVIKSVDGGTNWFVVKEFD